ncbi:MAG: toxin-antitoxin system YwqK family antitoxin [Saprospiraceae bacterium]|nr:toxin-antitoxin system YwqK family antitoxin [Saprospiraceae bacterium]
MPRWSIVLIPVLFLAACSSDIEVVELKDAEGEFTEVFERSKATGQKNGFYRMVSDDGLLIEEANYVRDTLHGVRKIYDEVGKIQIEENYVHGQFSGPYKTFYPDGQIELEGLYENNETAGIWKKYYPSGKVMEEVSFANNMENGPFKEYYESGKVKTEGTYLDGDNEHGELRKFDEEGVLVQKMDCQRGICRTTWTSLQSAEK